MLAFIFSHLALVGAKGDAGGKPHVSGREQKDTYFASSSIASTLYADKECKQSSTHSHAHPPYFFPEQNKLVKEKNLQKGRRKKCPPGGGAGPIFLSCHLLAWVDGRPRHSRFNELGLSSRDLAWLSFENPKTKLPKYTPFMVFGVTYYLE